jgi:hypothetical protein
MKYYHFLALQLKKIRSTFCSTRVNYFSRHTCCITIQGITSSYDERSVNQYIFKKYLKGTVYSS